MTTIRTRASSRARLTSQGQVTVPKAVRDELGARPGDDIEFQKTAKGFLIRNRPRISVLEFAGAGADRAEAIPSTAEAIDELVAAVHAERAVARQQRLASRRPRRGEAG